MRLKMVLHQDFKEFLILLNDNKVDYLIVGAFALGFYGAPRNTGDIDIWIRIGEDNAEKMVRVLDLFGFSSLNLEKKMFLEKETIIQLGYPPVRIDIITQISGVEFIDAYKRRINLEADGIKLDIIGKQDFIKNKKETGRLKDLADIERISKIQE